MGGFAAEHHNVLMRLRSGGEIGLVCSCDPRMDTFADRQKDLLFSERGVRLFTDYRDMLDTCRSDLDVVTIPTPIPLHAPMHQACVERGLAVYLEKPPTLDHAELERMIDVDSRAARETVVGFNFIVEHERRALKRRLAAGEFGRVQRVDVYALWPRNATYFARADWAGRLMKDGRLVLDSCIGNAMAHQVHNALFWCGAHDPWAWGEIEAVQAELYRAHRIEGLDTAFVAALTRQNVALRVAMSHACQGTASQEECITCDRAVIRYHSYKSGTTPALYTITWTDGRVETADRSSSNLLDANFLAYAAYVRGDAERPMTRLVDSRPFVHLNNLAYIAARRITTVPARYVQPAADGYLSVEGLPQAIAEFISNGRLPSTQSRPWAVPGGSATTKDLPALLDVVKTML
jgi:predicted dehydrogenase